MAGGLFWAVKGGVIMVARVQPPIIYELSWLFFPVAVVGLYALLAVPRSRPASVGLVFACVAELAALVSVAGLFFGPAEWTPTDSSATVLTPFITLANLGALLALLLVGVAVRRTHALPGQWATLPMLLALTAIPLILVSLVLQAINERLFELPTLLIGCEWIALGVVMAKQRRSLSVPTST